MTKVIVNKPYFPTLLLTPGASRDRNGPVTPTLIGGVLTVPGQYGSAWRFDSNAKHVNVDAGYLGAEQGTILFRATAASTITSTQRLMHHLVNSQRIYINRTTSQSLHIQMGDPVQSFTSVSWPNGVFMSGAVRWDGDTATVHVPDNPVDAFTFPPLTETGSFQISGSGASIGFMGDIEGFLAFDIALTDAEIQRIATMGEAWTWRKLGELVTRPEEITLPPPELNAGPVRGIIHIEDETFITDRDNVERIPVEGVEIRPNWDIDRAGSKGAAQITAEDGVLEPGMWLTTYRTITPERGEIIRYPRGHWHLASPGIAYSGGHELDTGVVSQVQTANASDIVDDLAGVMLTEAFYTPRQGHVMTDVYNLIKMATCGIMGPNLLTNGSFEDDSAGWIGGYDLGGGGSVAYTANSVGIPFDAPDKTKFAQVTFSPNMPAGARRWWLQSQDIPLGTEFMYASAVMMTRGWAVPRLVLRFFGESGAQVSQFTRTFPGSVYNRWYRYMIFAPVPPAAVSCAVLPTFTYQVDGPAWNESCAVDDVHLGTCTHMPIPDDRINLPATDAVASTRIQTAENKNLLYDAINADRLSAMGHYALATDMEGRLTSQPIRTLANATPRYTFGPNDIEMIGDVEPEILASNTRPYNHWFAVKESFEEGAVPMRADSYNNNANDRFSVVNSGSVSSAPQITVQDAVSQDALQAIADRARDSYSLSETVRFAIMPLDITVYDVVAIDDPDMPRINGVWAVNSIDASGDYLVITATRAVSREV